MAQVTAPLDDRDALVARVRELGEVAEAECFDLFGDRPNKTQLERFLEVYLRRLDVSQPGEEGEAVGGQLQLTPVKRGRTKARPPAPTSAQIGPGSPGKAADALSPATARIEMELANKRRKIALLEKNKELDNRLRLLGDEETRGAEPQIGLPPAPTAPTPSRHPMGKLFTSLSPATHPPIGNMTTALFGTAAAQASHRATPTLVAKLHATAAQREAARQGKFIALAYFLPSVVGLRRSTADKEAAGAGGLDEEEVKRYLGVAYVQDPERAERARKQRDAEVPRFRKWEDVVDAFLGGLIPVACPGNPDRYMDYLLFFHSISLQHSTGEEHWPVLLRYIEQWRKIQQPEGSDAAANNARLSHRLSGVSSATGYVVHYLEATVYQQAQQLFERNPLLVVREDFLDDGVAAALSRAPIRSAALTKESMAGDDPLTKGSSKRLAVTGVRSVGASNSSFTEAEVSVLRRERVCINNARGLPCMNTPCKFVHSDPSTIRSVLTKGSDQLSPQL